MIGMTAAIELLAEPKRRTILRLVWAEEKSAGRIARHFRVTFGAVSQHLARLLAAGLVRRRREGKQLFYVANREALGPLAAALEAMWSDKLGTLKSLAEAEQQRNNVDSAKPRHSRPKENP
jgi:DNA-binding transcriptional ArsR family regulator